MKLTPIRCALLLCLTAAGPAAAAPPAEVSGLVFEDRETASWNGVGGAAGYHLYRGDLGGLPDNGACHAGSLILPATTLDQDPGPGSGFFYLASAFNEDGESGVGTKDLPAPATPRLVAVPCQPARRVFQLTVNGDPGDGVVDGAIPRREPSLESWSSNREATAVVRSTGEFFYRATDLRIVGRGPRLALTRSYHSQVAYDGPLGHGWEFAYNARLAPQGSSVVFFDGTGRRELFVFNFSTMRFDSPQGLFAMLWKNADGSWTVRYPDGLLQHFFGFTSPTAPGALAAIADRAGNRLTLQYDVNGRLASVTDTLGRVTAFTYDAAGRIASVQDFSGRVWDYAYAAGDLTEVTSPAVTGTPNGNDFPSGKTTRYGYSSGFGDPRLNHNLQTITAPAEVAAVGPPRVVNVYGTTAATFELDRVVQQTIGGTNTSGVPAGGTIDYAYSQIAPSNPILPAVACRSTTITDRAGNIAEHTHNALGNELTRVDQTNRNVRPGEPDYTTESQYSVEGLLLQRVLPEGNRVEYTHDSAGPDRYRRANLLESRFVADTVASGGRGNGRGGEIADIVRTHVYEPLFNQRTASTGPRENDGTFAWQVGSPASSPGRETVLRFYDYEEADPASNGVQAYAAQYGIDLGTARSSLGDLNLDGDTGSALGTLVRVERPTASLFPGSSQAALEGDQGQDIADVYAFNAFGQLERHRDAEGNVQELSYHPEDDPDGDGAITPAPPDGRVLDGTSGGYLASRRIDTTSGAGRNNGTDPMPVDIEHTYRYDDVGNVTQHVDGRGVLTTRVVNALDQAVELRRAAAVADQGGAFGDPPTGRGESGLSPFAFRERYAYDANDRVVTVGREDTGSSRGIAPFIELTQVYDVLDRPVEESRPATAIDTVTREFLYDGNENRVLVIQPEGNEYVSVYDERDLLFQSTRGAVGPFGGTPSTETYDYDGNRNPIQRIDGRGNPTTFEYDGFDRPVREVDEVGNTLDSFYDPADNVVRRQWRGPIGGPPPPDRSGATNTDLRIEDRVYDELDRLVRRDTSLFLPAGATPLRPPLLAEGPLGPGDGAVNEVYQYDALSRETFRTRDSGSETRRDYDGAGRLIMTTLPEGTTVVHAYDANDNVVEFHEVEVVDILGAPPEEFLTTHFYDALDRLVRTVDSLGQTEDRAYDSLDAPILETDARGPLGGTIQRRSPGNTGISVQINEFGNVRRLTYDGLDRLVQVDDLLTASGEGDGTTNPPLDLSNPANPDGMITRGFAYDGNSRRIEVRDDDGDATTHAYDNLDRLLQRTYADLTQVTVTYDANDNVITRVDPNGSTCTTTYDAASRPVQTAIVRGAGVSGTTLMVREYDGLNRLTRATNDNDPGNPGDDTELLRVFDSLGRPVEVEQRYGGLSPKASDVDWAAHALPTKLTYPSGLEIGLGHDPADRLGGLNSFAGPEGAGYGYTGLRRVHGMGFGNGVQLNLAYDGKRRQVVREYRDSFNQPLAVWENAFDRGDHLVAQRDMHHPTGPGFRGELFARDSANRLTSAVEAPLDLSFTPVGPPSDDRQFSRDGDSNFTSIQHNGTPFHFQPANSSNEYDEPSPPGDDALPDDVFDNAATPFADGLNHDHDPNGNLRDAGLMTYETNALNQVTAVIRNVDGMPLAFLAYWPDGRLASRDVQNLGPQQDEQRVYYHGVDVPLSPVSDAGGSGDAVEQFDFFDQRVLTTVFGLNDEPLWHVDQGGNSQYMGCDARGNVSLVTHGNGPGPNPGDVLERVIYGPGGTPYFQDANNQFKVDGGGLFLPRSDFDVDHLWNGALYLDETGQRSNNRTNDFVVGIYMPGAMDDAYSPSIQRVVTDDAKSESHVLTFVIDYDETRLRFDPRAAAATPSIVDDGVRSGVGLDTPVFGIDDNPLLDWVPWFQKSKAEDIPVIVVGDPLLSPPVFLNPDPPKAPDDGLHIDLYSCLPKDDTPYYYSMPWEPPIDYLYPPAVIMPGQERGWTIDPDDLDLGLGDLNGNGVGGGCGTVQRTGRPATTLPDGSTQPRVYTFEYNPFGQRTGGTFAIPGSSELPGTSTEGLTFWAPFESPSLEFDGGVLEVSVGGK